MKLPDGWQFILQTVNEKVNAYPYRSDPERYGKKEFWEVADSLGGDCEDYALAKLRLLLSLGFPIKALRLATCTIGFSSKYREGHAVLVVDCPGEYYVLDNRFKKVMTVPVLLGMGYSLELIQKEGGSREWIEWRNE